MRAAYEQSKILLARRPIDQVVQDAETVDEDRRKLELVLAARAFSI
jgi:predicted aminopeptidase